jgi:hypothetical protein
MGESASSITITHGPDPRDAGTQLIVDHNVAALVQLDSSFIHSEIVGIWAAAYSEQQMSSANL